MVFLHGAKLFSDQTVFPVGFRMTEFLTRSRKQCGGDGWRAWGDAFSHVVLCALGSLEISLMIGQKNG